MKSVCGIWGAAARAGHAIGRFGRAEDGSMIMLGLWISVLMLMLGGLAVDLMRAELRRTELQQTADRAVLAAASLSQTQDAEAVVRDYFEKQGLSDALGAIDVQETINSKTVTVDAEVVLDPFFAQFLGIDQLTAPASSTAVERITDVEISLVLDVSGSMGSNRRLTNLKVAAKDFIDIVLDGATDGRTSISLIPYAGHVNLGDTLSAQYNMPRTHTWSFCADLPSSTFQSTDVSQTTQLTQAGHFDPYASTGTRSPSKFFCPHQVGNTVTPFSNDRAYLKSRIDALSHGGNTSIDIGMKWGAALLNPASQGVVSGLVDAGVVIPQYDGRPLSRATTEVLKIVVLMTDGENTTEYVLDPDYRTGMSNIWRRNSDGRASVYWDRSSTSNDYWWPDEGRWHDTPYGGTSGATKLTWPEVWRYYSLNYVADRLYSDAVGNSTSYWQGQFRTTTGSSTKISRLQEVCAAARDDGIVVFGIAFEAPSKGRQQIANCASSPGHYFDADGLEIREAFRMIASQITTLKLTQ
ncbi:MAG: Tad domain-containing protein [Rhodobacterales bacterium]|nr:Tad domain-containing protein [Rhodobacterales bacterium]